jgi:hypothetical protein
MGNGNVVNGNIGGFIAVFVVYDVEFPPVVF